MGRYSSSAIVLERSEICVVPFAPVQAASLQAPGAMMLLGWILAEERLVALLLDLAKRYTERGYPRLDFRLRMMGKELGGFLGLKPGTVSRLFARLQQDEILALEQRRARMIAPDRLERLIEGGRGRAALSFASLGQPFVEPDLVD